MKAGRQVYRATLAELIEALVKAEREGRLADKIRFYARPSLLIVDEIGYIRCLHRRAEPPGDDVAAVVIEDSREVEPAPADDLQVDESRPWRRCSESSLRPAQTSFSGRLVFLQKRRRPQAAKIVKGLAQPIVRPIPPSQRDQALYNLAGLAQA